jgi:DNA-nicking Smr family endonuclease
MGKKRKSGSAMEERDPPARPLFNSPFKDLNKLLKEHASARPQPARAAPAAVAARDHAAARSIPALSPEEDDAILREALAGVRPLVNGGPARIAIQPRLERSVVSEDAEVLAQLSDLVSGQGTFELTETDEYVEGARVGLDPRIVSRLRRGEFSVQAHIDLHGMIQVNAKEALTQFILESVRKGWRAVLVVHGRGRRSPGGQPVLKHATAEWLSHGTIGGYVLAFTTARAYDGGAGAVWVLLRRERQRAKFDVLQGAKRRD